VSSANLAPTFEILIAGQRLGDDISRFIDGVVYESADGIADVGKFTVLNRDGMFADRKLFQPGNEAVFRFGYGGAISFVGRVQLVKPQFNFPEADAPTIDVVGYTRDHQMMDNAPDKRVAERRTRKDKPKSRVWQNARLKEILEDKASTYGFQLDVDDYSFGRSVTQKPGMTDYDLVRGLANYLGFIFWVDGTEDGKWILHFKDPARGSAIAQEKKYAFRYNFEGQGTLLSFSPEYALRDARTKVRVEARNPDTGKTLSEEFEDDAAQPDLQSTGDPNEEVDIGITTGGAVKLFFGDFSLEVLASKNFRSPAELKRWGEQWFRRNREDFVMGNGSTIGVENVMARQTHRLEGLGRTLDGDYYFTRVAHKFSRDSGYKLEFTARKTITDSRTPQAQSPRRPPGTRTYRPPPAI